jgi:hypothetical protein
MPQYYNPDKENLDSELDKMNTNLYQMLDQGLLHEDMVSTIEFLISEWCKENLNTYQTLKKEFDDLSEDDKKYYADFDEYVQQMGRWWIDTFHQLTNQDKETFLQRCNVTIACCLNSHTYNEQTIKETIEESWNK